MINLYNMDCMEAMKAMPDKAYDLAICYPPYKLGMDGGKSIGLRKCWPISYAKEKYIKKNWDNEIPPPEYFIDLRSCRSNLGKERERE